MRIRVRGPEGQAAITLPDDATVSTLLSEIAKATSLQDFDVKYSYPPQPLQLDRSTASTTPLSSLGIKLNGEQLIVSNRAPPSLPKAPSSQPEITSAIGTDPSPAPNPPLGLTRKPPPQDTPEIPVPTYGATMVLRVMPDDNSCLFRAFSSATLGAELDSMHELRSIVAQAIQADPETYNEAILDKKPDEYCRWIQTPDAWGGGIEMSILSSHFDVEICSIDVQSLRVDKFGEGKAKRVVLVYSGIHYDVVALTPFANAPPEFDTKQFEAEDEVIMDAAGALCKVLQGQNYYTDTAKFSIKCNICGGKFVGEQGATEHASQTGHYDFAEG